MKSSVSYLVILGTLAGCTPATDEVEIHVALRWDGAAVDCRSAPVMLTDMRFYVSELHVGPDLAPATLPADGRWQDGRVALLDFEDGSGACRNGTAETNSALRVAVPKDAGPGLAFTIGVPADLNHANPLMAAAPLDDSMMHWHWRSGYKFLRAGVETEDDGYWMHLGSSGCRGRIGAIEGCDRPNRVTVRIDDFVVGKDAVQIDLARLFGDVDLTDGTATRCMSGPGEVDCEPAFDALGLGGTGSVSVFGRRQP